MAITAETITSATSGAAYRLWFHDGELAGCECRSRHFHPQVDCKHMRQYRQEQADKLAQATSCVYCGRASKSGLCFVCGGC